VVRLWLEGRNPVADVGLVLIASAVPPAVGGHQETALTCAVVGVVLALLRVVPGGTRATEGAPPGVGGEGHR
jgi:hypothetical protein